LLTPWPTEPSPTPWPTEPSPTPWPTESSTTPPIRSSDASLSGLSLIDAVLSPAFVSTTFAYSASDVVVPTVIISATMHSRASAITSGSSGECHAMECSLVVGSNTLSVVVTAQDETVLTYTIAITRVLPSTDAALASLAVGSASLDPAFSSSITTYTATIAADAPTTITVDALPSSSQVRSVRIVSSAGECAAGICPLNNGTTWLLLVVTAQDDATVKVYLVRVERLAPV
jgi:hypothetical protein